MLLLHVWRVLLCNLLNYQLQSVVMRRMWGVRGLETCNGRWQINFLTTCCVLSQCGELFLCQTLWSHCVLKFSQLLRQHCDDGVVQSLHCTGLFVSDDNRQHWYDGPADVSASARYQFVCAACDRQWQWAASQWITMGNLPLLPVWSSQLRNFNNQTQTADRSLD